MANAISDGVLAYATGQSKDNRESWDDLIVDIVDLIVDKLVAKQRPNERTKDTSSGKAISDGVLAHAAGHLRGLG